jgi:hypothetical protein
MSDKDQITTVIEEMEWYKVQKSEWGESEYDRRT